MIDLPLVAGLHYAGHQPQPNPWGCIYRSLVALTGERALLAYEADVNIAGAFARLPEETGLFALTLAKTPDRCPLGRDFWADHFAWLADYEPGEGEVAYNLLLLSVPSLLIEGNDGKGGRPAHAVGAVTCPEGVVVLDPSAPGERRYDLDGFLASPYGKAFEAHSLTTADAGGIPAIDGPTSPHLRATRERWRDILDSV